MNLFRSNKQKDGERVYMDYAASTPVDPEVVSAMEPYWSQVYGNPGSHHHEGRAGKSAITKARNTFAELLNCDSDEIVFTGSGTESNNLAIFGVLGALLEKGKNLSDLHFITTPIEHPSALDCFEHLEKKGASVTYIKVNSDGLITAKQVEDAIQENTVLISIMLANNEMGALLPIEDIGKMLHKRREQQIKTPYFHTDASQAALYIPLNVQKMHVDLMTLDGQKVYGPKGVGVLFRRKQIPMKQVTIGGNQEMYFRPGTENTPLIVGFAKAYELAVARQEKESVRVRELRDYAIEIVLGTIPDAVMNGPIGDSIDSRMPNNVNFSIPNIEGEFMAVSLSEKGFAVGTRSACIGEAGGPSYVIEAMGKPELALNSLRLSFGKSTSKEKIDRFVKELRVLVENSRRASS